MTPKIVPCLWFDRQAEEAVGLYTSLFADSRVGLTARYGADIKNVAGKEPGSLMTQQFFLAGQEFLALNGGPIFKFNQSLSLFVFAESVEEMERLWGELARDGKVYFPLAKYPFAERYGWCEDRFGLSWQFILDTRGQKISPALLFVNEQRTKVEEAIAFYMSIFPNAAVESIAYDPSGKLVLHSRLIFNDQDFVFFASPIDHDYRFTPAMSFMVKCEEQFEIDRYFEKLSAAPEAEQCGWLSDRYGVSWQIVPEGLGVMVADPDPVKSARVMQAVLKMKKLDRVTLERAFHGN